jgi:hypothetical protein
MALAAIEALRTFITDMSKYKSNKSEHELKFDYTIQNNPEYKDKGMKYADDIVFGPGFKIIDQSKKHLGGSATTATATTTTPTITYNKSQKKQRHNKKRYNKQRTIKMRR